MSKTQKASHCETVKSPLGGASQRNGVKNPKGLSLQNGQKPVRGCLAAKRCQKPKRPLAAKRFECKTPFEFDIAFAVFIPLGVSVCVCVCVCVCETFWSLYTPFEFIFPFGPFGRPYLCLRVHAPLYWFSAHVHVHPLMGFLAVSKTSEVLWGFHAVSPTSEALWGFHTVSWWVTPFGIFSSFRSDGHLLSFGDHSLRLDDYVCVWPFEYLFIYLFIYSFIHLFT